MIRENTSAGSYASQRFTEPNQGYKKAAIGLFLCLTAGVVGKISVGIALKKIEEKEEQDLDSLTAEFVQRLESCTTSIYVSGCTGEVKGSVLRQLDELYLESNRELHEVTNESFIGAVASGIAGAAFVVAANRIFN